MSRCAVVQYSDNVVVNIILADPTDTPPDGCFLVAVSDDQFLDIGWIYDPETGTFSPPPNNNIIKTA